MNTKLQTRNWFLIGVVSLIIVAVYGSLMRYKIAFNFPFLKQKYLLHAHSHFAFNGWVTHVLYLGLAAILQRNVKQINYLKYKILLSLNLIASYGMLVSFTIQGYKMVSIIFSTLTIVVSIAYTWAFIQDSKKLPKGHRSKPWAITGLIMSILSAFGPFYMAYMIMDGNINYFRYLGALYYFLHFQYNGWFFFAAMAVVAAILPEDSPLNLRKYFPVFAVTVIPTVFLSLLWTNLPLWLYIVTVIATFVEFGAWITLLARAVKIRPSPDSTKPKWIYVLFYIAGFAVSIKFILQAISVIPSLSELVFGIRSIVIAYLHLILLGVYSIFILAMGFYRGHLTVSRFSQLSAYGFVAGVFLNEFFLAVHGFAAFLYITIPLINELLFVAAVILLISSVLLLISQFKKVSAVSV